MARVRGEVGGLTR